MDPIVTGWRVQRMHTARKEHACVMGDVIRPGEQYVYEAAAPWARVQEDPEGPPQPLGEWVAVRYHPLCFDSLYYF